MRDFVNSMTPKRDAGIDARGVSAVLAVIIFYAVLQLLGITCPILFLTGVSCAGCGMTRAWLSLFHGDIIAAVHYHPIFWMALPAAAMILFRRRLPKRISYGAAAIILAAFLGTYIFRLASPDDTVVVFHPENGLIARTFAALKNMIIGMF